MPGWHLILSTLGLKLFITVYKQCLDETNSSISTFISYKKMKKKQMHTTHILYAVHSGTGALLS